MKNKAKKLTAAESKKLEQFVNKSEGQIKASLILGVSPYTLSRTVNRHTSPSPMLREKFAAHGIIEA